MNAKVNTHIYPRAAKANKFGKYPIYIRITINGTRKEFTTKYYIDPKKWDSKEAKVIGTTEEAKTINQYLDNMKSRIMQTSMLLDYRNEEIEITNFFEMLTGKSCSKTRTIVPIFQEHNTRLKSLIGKDYAEGTFQRYETALKHLQEFMMYQYGMKDYPINKLSHSFITDYDFYLRSVRNCANNTTVKYIKNLKKIINLCVANGWLDKDPLLNYKTKLHEIDRDILTQDELTILINKNLHTDRLDIVRDLFLFSCYTGLAFIDVKNLTHDNIIQGIDGSLWISTHRQKTDIATRIPLLDIPNSIINKHKDHPKSQAEGVLLPMSSNQKTNAYLKEIADLCGINKNLTFHCARHTFATTVTLSNGVPIESVSKMLGHKSIKTTQHYAKITDKKVANDMQILKNILDTNKTVQNKSKTSI